MWDQPGSAAAASCEVETEEAALARQGAAET